MNADLGRKRTGRFRIGTSQNSRFRMLVAFRSLISNKDNKRAREDARPNVATVFMILPPDRLDTYLRWLQLLAAQAISEMARSSAKPPRPVQFLLDEPEPVETRSGPYRIAFGSGMNEEGYSLAPD